jgi:hypothetical protein
MGIDLLIKFGVIAGLIIAALFVCGVIVIGFALVKLALETIARMSDEARGGEQ